MTIRTCEGCDRPMLAITDIGYGVCMACTRARMRAAHTKRCGCARTERRPTEVLGRAGARQWIGCHRCLGTIRQVA